MKHRISELLRNIRKRGLVSAAEAERLDVPRVYLTRLVRNGTLERVGRGLYMLAGAAVTEHHSLVQAAARIPEGVACLLSALRCYGLTTIVPMDVWLAVPPGAKSSRPDWPPIRVIRMSGYAMGEGVVKHKLEGIPVRVFELAKTVADCFRFRNKIGLDIALEALREYRRSRSWDPDELWRFARTDGVDRILLPYLEAVA